MNTGWKCPNCGKAHAPHVVTCPEPAVAIPALPNSAPVYPMPPTIIPCWPTNPRPWWTDVICGDPPGTIGAGMITSRDVQ